MRLSAIALVLLMARPAGSEPIRGDLSFPLEGWGIVARWTVLAGAKSAREGWFKREYNDRKWAMGESGGAFPAGPDGAWFRNAFLLRSPQGRDVRLTLPGLPPGSGLFLNGEPMGEVPADGQVVVRAGNYRRTNTVAVFIPGGTGDEATVPGAEVAYLYPDGRVKRLTDLTKWRAARESVERGVPQSWLKRGGAEGRVRVTGVPQDCRGWVAAGPLCLRATLDIPYYWRKRANTLYFHGIPGEPAVYLNGERVAERLRPPWQLPVRSRMKYDGRDTICLVYPSAPSCSAWPEGRWGLVAFHWEEGVRLPSFPSGSRVLVDRSRGAGQEGVHQALRYATELVALTSTSYTMEWVVGGSGTGYSCALSAAWPAGPHTKSDMKETEEEARARIGELKAHADGQLWIVTPPTAGKKMAVPANDRLARLSRSAWKWGPEEGVRVMPVFDVFRSALRRQRRWPAQAEWTDAQGVLTPHGSYLVGLVLLDNLSLP